MYCLACFLGVLGAPGRFGAALGALLDALGALLGPFWPRFGLSWCSLGRSWSALGHSWGTLGRVLNKKAKKILRLERHYAPNGARLKPKTLQKSTSKNDAILETILKGFLSFIHRFVRPKTFLFSTTSRLRCIVSILSKIAFSRRKIDIFRKIAALQIQNQFWMSIQYGRQNTDAKIISTN